MTYKEQLLKQFAAWMEQETDLKKNTRQRYASHVRCLLKNQQITGLDQLPCIDVPAFLKALKHGYLVKQHGNAFEYFQQFSGGRLTYSPAYTAYAKGKPDLPPVSEWEPLDYDKVCRTINAIRNPRLKVAYRLMLATGMRVSEVASVTKEDVTMQPGGVLLHVRDTKNGQPVDITCDTPYVVAALPQLTMGLRDTERVFYSRRMLERKAEQYGFRCHDLRRAAASDSYTANLESMPPREAKKKTAEEMRHSSTATTGIYLSRRITRK